MKAMCGAAASSIRASPSRSRRPRVLRWRTPTRPSSASRRAARQALRFDGVELSSDQTLESFFASGWIEGLENGSIQSTTINGLPAATATAKGKEWTFRLGAVRSAGTVYRLLYATRSTSPESERAFRETLGSIRRLSRDEIRIVKPWRVALVTARDGDTAERLAARMASDQGLDRFLVLNGLERGAPLRPGQRYKIVVE